VFDLFAGCGGALADGQGFTRYGSAPYLLQVGVCYSVVGVPLTRYGSAPYLLQVHSPASTVLPNTVLLTVLPNPVLLTVLTQSCFHGPA
jgi:hypothetical protein